MAAQTTPQSLAANKRRGQSLVALIKRRKDRITEDFCDIGSDDQGSLIVPFLGCPARSPN